MGDMLVCGLILIGEMWELVGTLCCFSQVKSSEVVDVEMKDGNEQPKTVQTLMLRFHRQQQFPNRAAARALLTGYVWLVICCRIIDGGGDNVGVV